MAKKRTRQNNPRRPPRVVIACEVRRATAQEIHELAHVSRYSVSRVVTETLEAVFPGKRGRVSRIVTQLRRRGR